MSWGWGRVFEYDDFDCFFLKSVDSLPVEVDGSLSK